MFVCTYVCVCVCTRMHVCLHMHARAWVCVCTNAHVAVYIYLFAAGVHPPCPFSGCLGGRTRGCPVTCGPRILDPWTTPHVRAPEPMPIVQRKPCVGTPAPRPLGGRYRCLMPRPICGHVRRRPRRSRAYQLQERCTARCTFRPTRAGQVPPPHETAHAHIRVRIRSCLYTTA